MILTSSARDQLFLEYINRARLDPEAEAARLLADPNVSANLKTNLNFGSAGLNRGLPAGTISGQPMQVLAPNDILQGAAQDHSLWMLDADVFSHTGQGGSSISQRIAAAGYVVVAPGGVGENLSWQGTTGVMNMDAAVLNHHAGLFGSNGHRRNTLTDWFKETGISQDRGLFLSNGTNWDASMLTQKFAASGTGVFLTGVAYRDADANGFYSLSEGVGGVSISAQGGTALTASAGGYALGVTAAADVSVTLTWGGVQIGATVDLSAGNVKLDIVEGIDGTLRLLSSSDLTLGADIAQGQLLGAGHLSITGNDAHNLILGNSGNNALFGGAGNDTLVGGAGDDTLDGGSGTNTARFSGVRADYAVTTQANGTILVADLRRPGTLVAPNDGTDTLTNIQLLQFSDQIMELVPSTANVTLSGTVTMREVASGAVNPAGTGIRFTASDGSVFNTTTDSAGAFSFDVPVGASGSLEFLRDYSTAAPALDKTLTTSDVLRMFRLVSGRISPENYTPEDLIAADFNGNGTANTADVLDLFRFVSGRAAQHSPEYIFINDDTDLDGMTFSTIPQDAPITITPLLADASLSITAILSGDLNGHV